MPIAYLIDLEARANAASKPKQAPPERIASETVALFSFAVGWATAIMTLAFFGRL